MVRSRTGNIPSNLHLIALRLTMRILMAAGIAVGITLLSCSGSEASNRHYECVNNSVQKLDWKGSPIGPQSFTIDIDIEPSSRSIAVTGTSLAGEYRDGKENSFDNSHGRREKVQLFGNEVVFGSTYFHPGGQNSQFLSFDMQSGKVLRRDPGSTTVVAYCSGTTDAATATMKSERQRQCLARSAANAAYSLCWQSCHQRFGGAYAYQCARGCPFPDSDGPSQCG